MNKNKREHKEIFFNVLTRTSNRPRGFHNCHQSIVNQTYKNVKHFVSYENEKDLDYINSYDLVKVKVSKTSSEVLVNANNEPFAPYNLFCNDLLDEVENGWILFLDDDDNFFHNKVLEELAIKIVKADEDTLFIWQMRYPSGKVLPLSKHFKNEEIEINHIGSPCIAFHSKYKDSVRWDSWKRSDFRFINKLFNKLAKKVWIKEVYIQINNHGDFGRKNDISTKPKLPYLFKKTYIWSLIPKYHWAFWNIYLFHKKTYRSLFKKIKMKLS
ncbi:hypothetical protein Q4Q35_12180 [Flavivirga aquimarina]|uniref:Glycosyltransferase 2-like domain-containing protein n=1 Tax=Flavivirga aquimarina TaxID=2027862 RepID=A0ABT8WBS2_9FLAO|nr:hypothetical protein [Flavivirga aquimarina]MDO5970565.1 hypothetical protein [Flavivirga aquimarina]